MTYSIVRLYLVKGRVIQPNLTVRSLPLKLDGEFDDFAINLFGANHCNNLKEMNNY